MRVGLFTDTYLPDINGVVSSVELLRKMLQKHGHEVFVICTYPGLIKVQKEGNIIRLPGLEFKKLYGYAVTSPIHLFLYDDIEALNLDLIHVHTEFGVGIFAQMCAEKFHLPIVRTYHTTYEDYTHYFNFFGLDFVDKYGKKLVAVVSKKFADHATKMISPSNKTKEMLLRYGVKTDIAIIPTGTELEHFNNNDISDEEVKKIKEEVKINDGYDLILYVGRIAQEKSLEMLIEAFRILKDKKAKMKLVVIGGGPQLDELMEIVKKDNLDDYIYFGNKRPFSVIPNYYHSADAFVSASTSETQGMTYVEAMASGLVVFARRDESTEDLIQENENGYFFDDADELVNKLLAFNKLTKDERLKMANVGINISQEYDAEVFYDKIIKVYHEAINEYNDSYTIEDTKLKNDYIELELIKADKSKSKILITLDDFYNRGLRKGEVVNTNIYNELINLQNLALAYKSSLKRLASRDYSIYEMESYLRLKHNLNNEDIKIIIDKLKNRGLLDDYKYALNKVSMLKMKFLSKSHMIANLKKVRISDEIIDKVIVDDEDEEYKKALKRAYYYQNSIKNKSLKAKRQAMIRKLNVDGFSNDIINNVMNDLDFSSDIFKESGNLRKEAYKQKKKYEKKYSGTELRNKIYHSLIIKGYSYDDIYAIINEMENLDE